MDVVNNPLIRKRSVSKVRRPFLNKKIDKDEPELIDPATKHITNRDVVMVTSSILTIKPGINIPPNVQYTNLAFSVSSITVGNHSRSKLITVNLQPNQKNINMPWDYMIKRLESGGDLELLAKAQEFIKAKH